jgi:hypothetical protein
MGLFKRLTSKTEPPPAVFKALALNKGERILAFGIDDNTGAHVVATTYAMAVVRSAGVISAGVTSTGVSPSEVTSTAELITRRRWLFVDAASWEPETATLTVTWADGARAGQWSFRDQGARLPETLRERVQASVVLSTRLELGDRRTGRVAIRQDFATRELIAQTILGRYARADDPEVQAHVQAALAHLRDQVGLPA